MAENLKEKHFVLLLTHPVVFDVVWIVSKYFNYFSES